MAFTVSHTCRDDEQKRIDTITWSIAKITSVLDDIENKKYDEFHIDNHEDLIQQKNNFKLKIKILGRNNDVLEIYYLFPKSVFIKSKLALLLRAYTERILVTDEYHEIQSNKWQYLATLFKDSILNDKSQFLLFDGSLKLLFTFEIIKNIVALENAPKGELSNDFQNLLDSGLFSDVIIKSAEGREFCVHKAILASRSSVLKAHFDHNTLECHTNIILSPLETDILSEVLTFIYTDKSPRVDDIPEKLLAAAEFYQLDILKSLCEQALQEKLSLDNVVETLELAELHSAKMLKKLTLEFIKDGHTKKITRTKGWAKIKSVDLIKSIYEHIMDVFTNSDDSEDDNDEDKEKKVDDIPEKLLAAAEFYQLNILKSLCEQALQEKLSLDNVVETLELAELYSAKMLKRSSYYNLSKITRTKGWAKIKSVDLIKYIYENIMDVFINSYDNDED